MNTYTALLRGINVGGRNKLPMAELRRICVELGLGDVRTYINSGNVLFTSDRTENELTVILERALQERQEKHIPVMIRTAGDLERVLAHNPFPDAEPSKVGVMFFRSPLPDDLMSRINNPGPEEVSLQGRELYIHYPKGMGRSKLSFPLDQEGTVRNIKTLAKLVALTRSE